MVRLFATLPKYILVVTQLMFFVSAYRKMNEILSIERSERLGQKTTDTMLAIMNTEPEETRKLVQVRNPPVSEAAARALEALRASGEPIPLDLSPKPIEYETLIGGFDEL